MIASQRDAGRAAALLVCLLACSCGQVGEPSYPSSQIPIAANDLVAVERGDSIRVAFTIPPRATDGQLLREVRAVELHLTPVDKTIDVPPPDEPGRVDAKIPVADLIGKRVEITERAMGGKRHYSGWSNKAVVNVEPPVAPPTDVAAKPVPAGVEVTWHATGADSFHIFRRDENAKVPAPIGTSNSTTFVDRTTEYGRHYEYMVQALHGKTESEVSAVATAAPVDVFPPAVPAGVTATAGIGSIELAWERNTEPDFAKYVVYRAVAEGPFEKLAETDAPAYSDKAVKTGTRYRYAISAVDQKNNESARSAPIEAVAP